MLMNSLYIDEDQKDHECEEFLEIKQFSHEPVSACIDRFEARKLQAEDLGLLQNDIITEKTFLDGLLNPILDKTKDGQKPRTSFEAKKELKTSLKTMVLEIKDKQIVWLDLKPLLMFSSLSFLR